MITTALPLLIPRPEQGQSDLPALVAFYQACEQADPHDHAPTLEQLQHRLDHPPPGGRHYRQLWETADGELAGVVALWMGDPRTDIPPDIGHAADEPATETAPPMYAPVVKAGLGLRLHPNYRHQGLEPILLAWAESQVQATRPDPGIPVHLRVGVTQDRIADQEFYGSHGFQMVRCFQELQRPLSETVYAPLWPAGVEIKPASLYPSEAWVALFNNTLCRSLEFCPPHPGQP